jgi:hypothetical protein
MSEPLFSVSETEAAERLEELVMLAKQGHEITIVADSGELFTLRPVAEAVDEKS